MLKIKADKMCELEKYHYVEAFYLFAPSILLFQKIIKKWKKHIEIIVEKETRNIYIIKWRKVGRKFQKEYITDVKYIKDLVKADMVEVCDD